MKVYMVELRYSEPRFNVNSHITRLVLWTFLIVERSNPAAMYRQHYTRRIT